LLTPTFPKYNGSLIPYITETIKSHRMLHLTYLLRAWYEKFDEKSLLFKMCYKNHCMRKKRNNTARSKNGNNLIGKVKTGFQFKIKFRISVVFVTLHSVSSFYALLNLVLTVVQTSKDGKLLLRFTFTSRMTVSNANSNLRWPLSRLSHFQNKDEFRRDRPRKTVSLAFNTYSRGVLKKVLYGEAPPRGPNPYPFIYHFFQKRYPFRVPFIGKRYPFHIPSGRLLVIFFT